MSASLIRRGLELLSDDIKDTGKDKKKKGKSTQKVQIMDLISSNREGVCKQVRRLQGRSGAGKSKATVKNKHIRSALDEYRKKQKKSHLGSNLEYFLGAKEKTQENNTKKILLQNSGRQSRNQPDVPVKKPQEEKSLFTEEQFQKFQKEYFGNL
ncbi:active regulator of SIRT1 [Chanos chanos]|uniref:Active regulator of SIRT1 n=1 Tax=Chanos chanos TaxID=29144 RepID=A0A6J2VZE9_CHACN|nr:active regulator of SIRT1 [Chanos chanos]